MTRVIDRPDFAFCPGGPSTGEPAILVIAIDECTDRWSGVRIPTAEIERDPAILVEAVDFVDDELRKGGRPFDDVEPPAAPETVH